jgi:hypothetical protein
MTDHTLVHPTYAGFDPDGDDLSNVSLCIACAKHPSLKRFVQRHACTGPVCGVCQKRDEPYEACDPNVRQALIYLIRALVRLEYNEFDYNHHWGGDSPESILSSGPNLIFEHASSAGHERSPETSETFLLDIFDDPYPPYDQGIAVYAGHSDGFRHINFSLRDRESEVLQQFRRRLLAENYYAIEPDVDAVLDSISTRIDTAIPKGAKYHRARIGYADRFGPKDGGWKAPPRFKPFSSGQLGAPPPNVSSAGRLNRQGVSYLYLASDPHTAAAEVRPHPGHYVSIGQFEAADDLSIASFDSDVADFATSDVELDLFHFVLSTNEAMATPAPPDAADRYLITQLIADCLRRRGYDGVAFRSSVAEGSNLCIFRPAAFRYVADSAQVQRVDRLAYSMSDVETLHTPDSEDLLSKGP